MAAQITRAKRLVGVFGPKLGMLYQHAPRLSDDWRFPPARVVGDHDGDCQTITLVTPTLNQDKFIERTIVSVLSQNYERLEYLVQDGGSTDRTLGIIEAHANRICEWKSERDCGQSDALNRAFSRSTGEVMGWLNSDDLLLPGTLAFVSDFFCAHPEVDVIYGNRLIIDSEDKVVGRWILPQHQDAILSWADFVPQETLFWRRSIWDKSGAKIDDSFRFAMDWDLLLRFRAAGAVFHRAPFFMGAFRLHSDQKTSALIADTGMEEMARLRYRALGKVVENKEILVAILPYLLRHTFLEQWWRVLRIGSSLRKALRHRSSE